MEKSTWSVGKHGGSVISNEKPERSSYDERCWEIEKEMTGGYIIAESIPSIESAKIMAAAPDMLEALKNIENDDNSIPDAIWKMRNDAIKKATE